MVPLIEAAIIGLLCVHVNRWASLSASASHLHHPLTSDSINESLSSEFLTEIAYCDRPVLEFGDVDDSRSNFSMGEKVQLSCQHGYRFKFIKSPVVVCQANGTWKDIIELKEIPKCERIGGCSQLPYIDNGSIGSKVGDFMPGDVTPVICNNGFHLMPHDVKPLLMCMNDGQWKPVDESVELICKAAEDCLWPTPIAYGFVQVLLPDGTIIISDDAKSGSRAVYHCSTGFLISNGSAIITCVDGRWHGEPPTCRLKQPTDRCSLPPAVSDAQPYLDDGSMLDEEGMDFAHGTRIIYICDYSYFQQGSSLVTCVMGEWIGQGPKCVPEEKYCNSFPPELVHGDYSLHGKETFMGKKFPPGLRAFYYCNNGHRLKDVNFSILTCADGVWKGNITSCIPRTNCDPPMDIENGNWIIESLYSDFRIGVSVLYECDEGYKAVGDTEIICQAPGYWSDYGPRCLPLDLYCAEPEPPRNGFFMCKPSHCDFFRVGTEVHHICNKNFEPHLLTTLVQTCMPGGTWSGEKPHCLPVNYATTNVYSLNANSVTVVVSTACGVLGLLISIMVVVVIKRCKKRRGHLCPPASGPPSHLDYSSHCADDQDREALIPYVEFASTIVPTLPTYEEAVTNHRSPSGSPASATVGRASSARPSRREFRSLPGARTMGTVIPFQRDLALLESCPHRNSITTVASSIIHADNGSITFGSIETVNVSDATSTSVTVDTCDSMASNPSIAMSHRVAAGSIDLSFANEFQTTNDGGQPTVDHRDSDSVASCTDHSSDHFHLNQSLSESTPILEMPEDGRDD